MEAARLFQSIRLESCLLLNKEELTCLSECTADCWPRASITSAPSPCWGYRCVPQTQVLWIEVRPSCLCVDTLFSHIQIHVFTLPLTSTEVGYSCFRTHPTLIVPPHSWGLGWTLLSYPATDPILTFEHFGKTYLYSKDLEGCVDMNTHTEETS